jgi:hemoglobin
MKDGVPTLYSWAGGAQAFEKLTTLFYERVGSDTLLAPVFANTSAAHAKHVGAFIAEVFGGPKVYSEQLGGHPAMIQHHLLKRLTEAQRARRVTMLAACADEVGTPTDTGRGGAPGQMGNMPAVVVE